MKSCLIVDDSSVVRKVARRILEDLDYIVEEAEDGQEAFEKCRQPKKPLCAESGEGCGAFSTRWRDWSTNAAFFCA